MMALAQFSMGAGGSSFAPHSHGKAGASSIALRGLVEVVKSLALSVALLVMALCGFIRFIIAFLIMTPKALGGVGFISLPLKGGDMNPPLRQWGFRGLRWVQKYRPILNPIGSAS